MAYPDDRDPFSPVAQARAAALPVPAPTSSPSISGYASSIADKVGNATSGIRAVLGGAYDDASKAFGQGNYGEGAGQIIRGLAAFPVGMADDLTRGLRGDVASAVGGASTALRTAYTGGAPVVAPVSTGPISTAAAQVAVQPGAFNAAQDSQGAAGSASLVPGPVSSYAAPQTRAPAPQPLDDSQYSIVKRYLDENGKPTGQVIRVPKAAQAQAATTDPIDRQREQFDFIRQIASAGDPRSYEHRVARLAQAFGIGQVGSTQERQNALTQQAPLTAAQASNTNAQALHNTGLAGQTIQLLGLQQKYIAARDAGDHALADSLAEQIGAVGGRPQQDKYLVVPGGQEQNEFGQNVTRPSSVYDTRNKAFVTDQTKAPAPKYDTGKVYQDKSGNKAKWDGRQFVPA